MKGSHLQRIATNLLMQHGWLVIRVNSGGQRAEYTTKAGQRKSRWFWFSKWYASGYGEQTNGVSDLMALAPGGGWYVLEIKGDNDSVRPGQAEFMAEVEARGGKALVIESVEQVVELCEQNAL